MSYDKWTVFLALITAEAKPSVAAEGGSTDLSAGVEPLFAPAAQPALSPFPVLKGSQKPFPPHEPVPHSLCPVWGKGPGC